MKTPPLYGLVLAGGKSSRMNQEKAKLSYHGKAQYLVCHDLLKQHCEKVFISARRDQNLGASQSELAFLYDREEFSGINFTSDIASLQRHPG